MSRPRISILLFSIFLLSSLGFFSPPISSLGIPEPVAIGKFLNNNLPNLTPGIEGATTYSVVPAYPNLSFTDPLVITSLPSLNRIFVASRQGLIEQFVAQANVTTKQVSLDLQEETAVVHDGGFLGLAFHPNFGTPSNNYLYAFYSAKGSDGAWGPTVCLDPDCFTCEEDANWYGSYLRLSRYEVDPQTLVANKDSELQLFNIRQYNGTHRGGALTFGTDGFLYCTIGDQARYVTAQDISSNFEGGIIRIDVDEQGGRVSHAPRRKMGVEVGFSDESSGNGYFIPNDNPWTSESGELFEEFVYVGNRNPHRMTLDRETGELWIGEVGQNQKEEVSVLRLGGNGGWPLYEGNTLRNDPTCGNNQLEMDLGVYNPPIQDFLRTETRSIIGGYVYRGSQLPDLYGSYICGGHALHKIFSLSPTPNGNYVKTELLSFQPGSLITFGETPEGELLMGRLSSSTPLYTMVGRPSNPSAPQLLSQTGAFKDLAELEPSDGLIPFDLIEPFWSDGAEKFRWMAIPNDGAHDTPQEQIGFSEDGIWTFPVGSVLIKHFELGGKRLETRFEVHGEDGIYYYLTYKWNAAGTEAELLNGALDEEVEVNGTTQIWHYPSQAECQTCHIASTGSTLGPRTRNLNTPFTYPQSGISANQVLILSQLGIIKEDLTEAQAANFPTLASKSDPTATLEHRARSYLDVNCAYCHQPGTGNRAAFDLRYTTPLSSANLINGALLNAFGNPEARIIRPKDTENSMLFHRLSSLDLASGLAMPPLSKNVLDQEGINLVAEWINSLNVGNGVGNTSDLFADSLITNGSAVNLDGGCTQLTPAIPEQAGSAWFPEKVDLSQDLSISFNLSLGLQDEIGEVDNGGDGVVFLFQSLGDTVLSRVDGGSGLGATGVLPSIGIEFDTYDSGTDEDIPEDHLTIFRNGVLGDAVSGPVCIKEDCSNAEDGEPYPIQIEWKADSQILRVYVNESLRAEWEDDLVQGIFQGDSLVYLGLTAAVGGAFNEQLICNFQVQGGGLLPEDGAVHTRSNLSAHSAGIRIFPNPGQGDIQISWDDPQIILSTYRCYDLSGKLIHSDKWNGAVSRNGIIPTSNWVPGTYILSLEDVQGRSYRAIWVKN